MSFSLMTHYAMQMKCNVDEVAVFTAASEGFSRKNINCSIEESLQRFEAVVHRSLEANVRLRGYVSCVIACPYDGPTRAKDVAKVRFLKASHKSHNE